MKNRNSNEQENTLQGLAVINKIGFSVITPILIGVYIGRKVDKKMTTKGVFSVIFIILGAIIGFLSLIKIANKSSSKK